MDAFTLVGKLVLDSSEFDSSLAGIEKKASGGENAITKMGIAVGNFLGNAMTKGARGMVNFAKSSVETQAQFTSMMSAVRGHAQLTADETEALTDRAIKLGATTKFTATEVGQAFDYMAYAGWDTQKMLNGIDGVLSLAAASGSDLGTASDIVTDAMTAFGLEGEKVVHFADVLAAVSANANTNVNMLGYSFKYAAPLAGSLGISVEETALQLGLMANAGIKSTQAGTSLRRIMTNLTSDTKAMKVVTDDLKVELFEVGENGEKKFRGLNTVIGEIREKWKGLDDDQQKSNFAKTIAGQYGLSAWLALMDASGDSITELQEAIENADGSAKAMSETMMDNLMGDVTLLNSAMESLKLLISGNYDTQIRSFIGMLTEEVGNLMGSFEERGFLGMFNDLTDWLINGITGALSNPEITEEGANDFGEALGDFVGHLVNKLVTNAPQIVSGLFTAGMNLAGGLVEGLFAGLFGYGDGTINGILTSVGEEQEKAIADAEATSTKATGIVNYMDSLVAKYGDAATNTNEWAAALGELEKVLPGITAEISGQASAAGEATAAMRAYIEGNKQLAIEQAKQAAIEKYRNQYNDALANLGTAEINKELNEAQAQAALSQLIKYVAQDQYNKGGGESVEEIEGRWRKSFAEDQNFAYAMLQNRLAGLSLGENGAVIEETMKTYESAKAAAAQNASDMAGLSDAASKAKTALDIAESAFNSAASAMGGLASRANGVSFGGMPGAGSTGGNAMYQAIGGWDIPYDNFLTRLHRGEMVLNATQARKFRDGNYDSGPSAADIGAAVRSAMIGMAFVSERETIGRVVGDQTTDRVNRNIGQMSRRHRYGYGG